jgi:hypothetical protein
VLAAGDLPLVGAGEPLAPLMEDELQDGQEHLGRRDLVANSLGLDLWFLVLLVL